MAISIEDIQKKQFTTRSRGYDKFEVDTFLEDIMMQMDSTENELNDLRRKCSTLYETINVYKQTEDSMKELLLLSLTYMLVVVWYLVPGLFLSGVVRSYSLIEQLMIHGFKIVVAKNHVQMSPFLVHVSSCERAVVVPDAALTGHSGDGDFHKNRSLQNS